MREIGKILNLSEPSISNIHSRALIMISDSLANLIREAQAPAFIADDPKVNSTSDYLNLWTY